MSKPIFEQRHFAWLAAFAAENLNDEQTERLIRALAKTNPKFDAERFASAAKAIMRFRGSRFYP